MKMILGRKIGMTRVFDKEGMVSPVTVVEAGPCTVVQVKDKEKNGYQAIQLGFGEKKHLSKPEKGHLKKSESKSRWLREVRVEQDNTYKVGDKIKVDIFMPDESVQVTGIGKGKGFAGTVKRHNFTTGPKTHGSDNYRQPGSIGSAFPQRVIKGRRMSGHMGSDTVTVKGLKVIDIDLEKNLLVLSGAIPGPKKSFIIIKGLNA